MFAEAVLIPILNLQVTVTGIPKCFERDNKQLAMNNDGYKGPIGQFLLGAVCTKYFPRYVTKNGKQVKTENSTLLKSELTMKISRFSAGILND